MKILISILFISLISTSVFAAELEKSRIKSNESFLAKNNSITYQGNVRYTHGALKINADKLSRDPKSRKINVTGNPVKVTFKDVRGEETQIVTPEIIYFESTGEIVAKSSTQSLIQIEQTSRQDRLKLIGSKLNANRKTSGGFSFTLTGNPTRFELQRPNQPLIEAQATSLSSNGKGRQTRLNGNVKLRQGDSVMAAASMLYDGETELISAQQSEDGSQRVETEFFWDKEEQEDKEQP